MPFYLLCGISTEGQRQRAKLCSCLISDIIFWFFYFTLTLASRCNALPKKVPKRIIQKKRQQQMVVCQSPVVLACSSFVGLLYFSIMLTERDMLLGERD